MFDPFDNDKPDVSSKPVKKQIFGGRGLSNKAGENLRRAVRYDRAIANVTLYSKKKFFSPKPFTVELLDISAGGARLASKRKLSINTCLTLKVVFSNGGGFEIPGKIVREDFNVENGYGFRFDSYHDELGDYLFRTQTHSVFKASPQ